jgi:ribonuclease P protein component
MIPKKQRLQRNLINKILHKGQKVDQKYFSYKYAPSKSQSSRFCVIISLKVSPKAVIRNRLRRKIYEIIRLNAALVSSPYDIIIICKKGAPGLAHKELLQEITKAFKKI